MTTFSTRNQSKKKIFTCVMAGTLFLILVTVIVLFKKHKNEQMYKGYDQRQQRSGASNRMKSPSTILSSGHKPHQEVAIKPSAAATASATARNPFYQSATKPSKVVNIGTNGGPVKGQMRRTISGKVVTSFLGIPYASPPVEDLRFESPKACKPWTQVIDAFYQPAKCPQGSYLFSSITAPKNEQTKESEDCLYLNIWTPGNDFDSNKKPVLVYLHSGLFSFGSIGSPDLDPSNLTAEHDIVVITVQYRLGAFGFASFKPENGEPNYQSFGLQDQAKALEWIRDNIGAFGGDPKQVTISGHGAGAISIGAHLLNPQTRKLFHRVIVQGLDNIWNIGLYGINEQALYYIANDLGCDLSLPSNKAWKKCVKKLKINTNSIIETQQAQMQFYAIPFGPQFNPHTTNFSSKLAQIAFEKNEKPTTEQLKMLFQTWNLFPSNIEFMIGLNSDDDYKFESVNRYHSSIKFDDDDDDEGEGEEEENENDEIESPKKLSIDEEEEEEGKADLILEPGQLPSMNETLIKSTTLSPENDGTATNDESITKRSSSLVQRRRRRQSTSVPVQLDSDETIKLCRLVSLYRASVSHNKSSTSGAIYLYRVDPKVLQSPLEEVSIAFGAKQKNWLIGFDERLMSLWGSFVRMGDYSQMNQIGLDYRSMITELDSNRIDLINLGQDSSDPSNMYENYQKPQTPQQSQLAIKPIDGLNEICSIQQQKP